MLTQHFDWREIGKLHYLTIMNKQVCILLLLLTLVGGFLHGVLHPLFVYNLRYCGPNVIDHFICDMYPMIKLACTVVHIHHGILLSH